MKKRCCAAKPPAIAGARPSGAMKTGLLRSGEMTITEQPTRVRYRVMLMIFICVVITYLDRSNISITAAAMQKDLHIDNEHMGWIFSGFAWTYAFFQMP